MSARRRCSSQFWTPELGVDAWLACVRRAAHRGDHQAAGLTWDTVDEMAGVAGVLDDADARDTRHSIRRHRRGDTALPDAS